MTRALIIVAHDLEFERPQVLRLAGVLAQRKIATDLLGPIAESVAVPRVNIVRFRSTCRWSALSTAWRGFWRALLFPYDLIIAFHEAGTIATLPLSLLGKRCPLVIYCLEYFDDVPGSGSVRLGRGLLRWWGHRAGLVVDANEARSELRRATLPPEAHCAVIHNAAPLELETRAGREHHLFDGRPSAEIRVVYAGGLDVKNCLEPLVMALGSVTSAVRLYLLGRDTGHHALWLKSLVASLPWSKAISFCGLRSRPELDQVLRTADIGVAFYGVGPSVPCNERLCAPNKIYEYLACGLPVVCSNNPTLVSLVQENGWGLCVDPEDPHQIGAAIEALARDPPLRSEFRRNASSLYTKSMNYEAQLEPILGLLARLGV